METEHHAIKLEHKPPPPQQQPQPQQQQRTNSSSSPVRSSASSSPSHEFSFAISLHSSAATTTTPSKIKQQPLAIDLSPADDIFFHGHLLPLHFLSHLHSSSPRRLSTHSSDNFPLPLPDFSLRQDDHPLENNTNSTINSASEDDYCISFNKDYTITQQTSINIDDKDIIKSKSSSFSLFGLSKWKKGSSEKPEESNTNKTKKLRFEMMSQFVKKYIKMVKPLLSGGKREGYRGRKQSYSFSGTVSPRAYAEGIRGRRRGDFSAPASMRTSPTNSGLLSATVGAPSPVSDSTMEELQAAIQAAIAHCKNSSISSVVQDNNKNPSNELQSNELSSIPVN